MARLKLPNSRTRPTQAYRARKLLGRALLHSIEIPSPTPQSFLTSLPIRIRPAFLALCFVCFIPLALLGFHPNLSGRLGVNDKIQHFIGLGIASACFYSIWEVQDSARRVFLWRNLPEWLTGIVCFFLGGFLSEVIQSMLPHKTFQYGDVLANLAGSTVGLLVARHAARRVRHKRELAKLYQPLEEMDEPLLDEEAEVASPEMQENQKEGQKKGHGRKMSNVWDDEASGSDGELFAIGEEELER